MKKGLLYWGRWWPRAVAIQADPTARYFARRVHGPKGAKVRLGEYTTLVGHLICETGEAAIAVGDRTFIGTSRIIAARRVNIGSDVLISWDVTIVDHNSHAMDFAQRAPDVMDWYLAKPKDWSNVPIAPVTVSDKVWIGFGATILKGVTVGEGAVIGAKSVVTKDVAPWTVVAGNPARVIRSLEPR